MIAQGAPLHGVVDPIVNPGQKLSLSGKFSYGAMSKDLEDEKIAAFVQAGSGCGKWEAIGTALTDDDGQVSFEVPSALLAKTGRRRFELVVVGDLSRATGSIWVLPKKQKVVVFDIDGTLSTGDDQLVEKLLAGHEVKMRPGGPDVARAHHKLGRQVIYITGRPRILAAMTRAWLERKGFVGGPVITTMSMSQSSPTKDGVQKYKRDKLGGLIKSVELDFVAAYGNAETDICAYAQAGIAPAKTFIIGVHAGKACPGFAASKALQDGYPPHLPTVR